MTMDELKPKQSAYIRSVGGNGIRGASGYGGSLAGLKAAMSMMQTMRYQREKK